MRLTRSILRVAAPIPDPEEYQRFLFVGPHPDDIEIGAGATAAKLAAAGKEVCFVICTDGRYGSEHLPAGTTPEKTARIRERESVAAAAYLGVKTVHFLRHSDGGFYDPEDLVRDLARVVGDFRPDMIFAPDPRVSSECHVDHLRAGEAAGRIACLAPYAGIMERFGTAAAPVKAIGFYMTAKPNQIVKTTGFLRKQIRAVRRYHISQFPPKTKGQDAFGAIELYLRLRALEYGRKSGHVTAEAFRVLGVTHMHCLPEAGE